MNTKILQGAIEYVLATPKGASYISGLEAEPDKFIIYRIMATVADYHNSIIEVVINFNEKGNPNKFNEDVIVKVQTDNKNNYRVLSVTSVQLTP